MVHLLGSLASGQGNKKSAAFLHGLPLHIECQGGSFGRPLLDVAQDMDFWAGQHRIPTSNSCDSPVVVCKKQAGNGCSVPTRAYIRYESVKRQTMLFGRSRRPSNENGHAFGDRPCERLSV